MQAALRRLGYELGATLIRLCATIGAIAMLGVGAVQFLDTSVVSAASEPVVQGWVEGTTEPRPRPRVVVE